MISFLIRAVSTGLRAAAQLFRSRPESAEPAERLQGWYVDTGVSYYLAARWAFFTGAHPVSGNLFHHAIEMLLKGCLCHVLDERERRRFGHHLRRLWRRYKREMNDPTLSRFDETISRVDRLERLRYPEGLSSYSFQFGLRGPFGPTIGTHAPPKHRQFELAINDVDEFVAAIFAKASLNPQFFTTGFRAEALQVLRRDNPTGIW